MSATMIVVVVFGIAVLGILAFALVPGTATTLDFTPQGVTGPHTGGIAGNLLGGIL